MSQPPAQCLLIGVDGGSRDAISPLAAYPPFAVQATDSPHADQVDYWVDLYEPLHATGIVSGTSDSPAGRKIESAARLAASRRNMKVAAIEDYPGNYFDVPGAHTDLLIAESIFSGKLYRERLGSACPPIAIYCSARYDHYRAEAEALRLATQASWRRQQQAAPGILWAGQPESRDCLETLRRIAPAVTALGAMLLIKAHPRDRSHPQGVYTRLLQSLGVDHSDVTGLSVAQSLALAPRLIITQFSSVAVEAGFYGIPALHLVYCDVGGASLQRKKGFEVPPYCLSGAGFYLKRAGSELDMLRTALCDEAARKSVIGCFDDFFATRGIVTPALADHLARLMGLSSTFSTIIRGLV